MFIVLLNVSGNINDFIFAFLWCLGNTNSKCHLNSFSKETASIKGQTPFFLLWQLENKLKNFSKFRSEELMNAEVFFKFCNHCYVQWVKQISVPVSASPPGWLCDSKDHLIWLCIPFEILPSWSCFHCLLPFIRLKDLVLEPHIHSCVSTPGV